MFTPTSRFAVGFVSFDIEAVVRPSEHEPYTQQRIYQIGGVRFGKDTSVGNEAQPQFTAWLELGGRGAAAARP